MFGRFLCQKPGILNDVSPVFSSDISAKYRKSTHDTRQLPTLTDYHPIGHFDRVLIKQKQSQMAEISGINGWQLIRTRESIFLSPWSPSLAEVCESRLGLFKRTMYSWFDIRSILQVTHIFRTFQLRQLSIWGTEYHSRQCHKFWNFGNFLLSVHIYIFILKLRKL